MNSRRQFLQKTAGALSVASVASFSALIPNAAKAAVRGSYYWALTSDPTLWAQAWAKRFLNIAPNPLSPAAVYKPLPGTTAEYTISAGQTTADVLGVNWITTTVWGYYNHETGPTFPGRTFEVQQGAPITVHWVNQLVDSTGNALPHIMPVDQTIAMQAPSTGVPLAVHHHGSNSAAEFDGGPDQWSTPLRRQTGPGITGNAVQVGTPGAVTYIYDNNQEASLHWYHDHAETLTGVNVWAGLAGLYVVRDANESNLQATNKIPSGAYEIGLVLQDRAFDAAGQFVYSASPANSGMNVAPPVPLPATFPKGNAAHSPEVFADVILVNGVAWPSMYLEPRPYRVRILNGSDSRFFQLNLGIPNATGSAATTTAVAPIYVIGNDLGFLNKPIRLTSTQTLLIGPGERYDLLIDFSWAALAGGVLTLVNTALTPYPAGGPVAVGANLVMQFNVSLPLNAAVPKPTWMTSANPALATYPSLRGANGSTLLPATVTAPAGAVTRRILLAEGTDQYQRILPMLGSYDPTGLNNKGTLSFADPATETPALGSTEIWEFWNTTVDAHPIHMHLVKFRILNRQAFAAAPNAPVLDPVNMANGWQGFKLRPGAKLAVGTTLPANTESGWKDTVVCPPGQVTRVVATFDRPGKFVYHCHILSHEDHEMMRWFSVQ